MQKAILMGNVGNNPEKKITPSGKNLCTFSLAVKYTKDKTQWHDIVLWEEKIEMFAGILKNIAKGSKLIVMGDMMLEPYMGAQDTPKLRSKVLPISINFASSGGAPQEKKVEQAEEKMQAEMPF